MSAVRQDRNKGRRTALQVLYAAELTEHRPASIVEDGLAPEEVVPDAYAMRLLAGVADNLSAIDERLKRASENWAVSRMPVVDKCILRLAVYEMLFVDEVPVSVTINEAVNLAKEFGGEDESHRFVNGVLGRIAQEPEQVAEDEPAAGETLAQGEVSAAAEDAPAEEVPAAAEDAPAEEAFAAKTPETEEGDEL